MYLKNNELNIQIRHLFNLNDPIFPDGERFKTNVHHGFLLEYRTFIAEAAHGYIAGTLS